jgi:hypothetical protein
VPAGAYFTATDTSSAALQVNINPVPDIEEEWDAGVKNVTITNSKEATADVYVRARAYSVPDATITATGWTKDGDWYVYDGILKPGDSTAKGSFLAKVEWPVDPKEKDEHNVIVVYEATPVQYDASGNAMAPDWDLRYTDKNEGGN